MNEERYNPQNSDALERAIISELGERQRKVDLIGQWEKTAERQPRRFSIPTFAAVAVAACAALLLVFAPWQRSADAPTPLDAWMQSEGEATRGAQPADEEVVRLIRAEDYTSALAAVDSTIASARKQVADLASATDEESQYELLDAQQRLSEAEWLRICLLLQLDRTDEARTALKAYLENAENTRMAEAQVLWEQMH